LLKNSFDASSSLDTFFLRGDVRGGLVSFQDFGDLDALRSGPDTALIKAHDEAGEHLERFERVGDAFLNSRVDSCATSRHNRFRCGVGEMLSC
jgi:hypothetical protein